MTLHSQLFGDPEVAAHLSDEARLQAMLDVEVALADAEASVGLIPAGCVAVIRTAARAEQWVGDVARDHRVTDGGCTG